MHIALLEDEPTLAQEVKTLLEGAGLATVCLRPCPRKKKLSGVQKFIQS